MSALLAAFAAYTDDEFRDARKDWPAVFVAKAGPVYWEGEHVATLTHDVELAGRRSVEPIRAHSFTWPNGKRWEPGDQFPHSVVLGVTEMSGKAEAIRKARNG